MSNYAPPDPNDILAGGGKSAKFPTIGTTVEGTVVDFVTSQQTSIDGEPLTWDDGSPRWQIVVTLQTAEREDDADDGLRKMYCKGNLLTELKAAVKASGEKLAVGGVVKAQYHADGEAKRGYTAPKLYKVRYTPAPARSVDLEDF